MLNLEVYGSPSMAAPMGGAKPTMPPGGGGCSSSNTYCCILPCCCKTCISFCGGK